MMSKLINVAIIPAEPGLKAVYQDDAEKIAHASGDIIAWKFLTFELDTWMDRGLDSDRYYTMCEPLGEEGDLGDYCIGAMYPDGHVEAFAIGSFDSIEALSDELFSRKKKV